MGKRRHASSSGKKTPQPSRRPAAVVCRKRPAGAHTKTRKRPAASAPPKPAYSVRPDLPKRQGLRRLVQISYPEVVFLKELQAKKMLFDLGVLGKRSSVAFQCFACDGGDKQLPMTVLDRTDGLLLRCENPPCRIRVNHAELAWTLLWGQASTRHDVSCKDLLRTLYVYACMTGQDSAVQLTGLKEDKLDRWFHMIRVALAYTELAIGKEVLFPDGVVEGDATVTAIDRSHPNVNVHRGRFYVLIHRDTGQWALRLLDDAQVPKGAAGPPEKYDEIKGFVTSNLRPGHLFASDSGQAQRKVGKCDLAKIQVPHATVVHRQKQFTKLFRVPLSTLPPELRKVAAEMPSTSARTMRVTAGDESAEGLFGVVKRNLTRLNLRGRPSHAAVNFLASAYLSRGSGLAHVCSGIKRYREAMTDQMHPRLAYHDVSFLTDLEHLG